jgi:hypothetical protein
MGYPTIGRGVMATAAVATAILVSVPPGTAAERCKAEEGLKSQVSEISSKIRFVNRSRYKRHVYWLDFAGGRNLGRGGIVRSKDSLPIDTFVGHVFVVTNSNDGCIGVYAVDSKSRTISLN